MPNSQQTSKVGATPGKLVLMGVLAVVFVVVLIVQFGGDSSAEPSAALGSETSPPLQNPVVTERRPTAKPDEAPTPWPVLQCAEVIGYDPFSTPSTLADDSASSQDIAHNSPDADRKARQEQTLKELQSQGVKAVYGGGPQGMIAVVGSETVRIGQKLGGFRVVAIGPNGISLEPIEQP